MLNGGSETYPIRNLI